MALLNYSTKIESEQTIGEIQKMLSGHGVSAMMTEYDGPHVSAVSFKLSIQGKSMGFRMPCNWKAVYQIFTDKAGKQNIWDSEREKRILEARKAQAIRTAWRIIHTWVKAQLALVEVNMVTIPQVFLPYAIMHDGRTLSEHVETNPGFLLGDEAN
jgi:hypothetical protein